MGLLIQLFIGFQFVLPSPYFTPLREDLSIPEKCRDMRLSFYQLPSEKIFAGRAGAVSMGFTVEYPLERKNATVLWNYFKGLTHGNENLDLLRKIENNPELKRDYDVIAKSYEEMDFDFGNEGEILEILIINDLYNEFPENHYYITGGVEYHEAHSPRVIGEVDLFVGNRMTCESVVVGEVKLGKRRTLSKAKQQLSRFGGFLRQHNAAGIGKEYVPRERRQSSGCSTQ